MGESMHPHGVKAGVGQQHFDDRAGGRVALEYTLDVFAND
jgi:hypothetical protein